MNILELPLAGSFDVANLPSKDQEALLMLAAEQKYTTAEFDVARQAYLTHLIFAYLDEMTKTREVILPVTRRNAKRYVAKLAQRAGLGQSVVRQTLNIELALANAS